MTLSVCQSAIYLPGIQAKGKEEEEEEGRRNLKKKLSYKQTPPVMDKHNIQHTKCYCSIVTNLL